jgi:hypothetical protein
MTGRSAAANVRSIAVHGSGDVVEGLLPFRKRAARADALAGARLFNRLIWISSPRNHLTNGCPEPQNEIRAPQGDSGRQRPLVTVSNSLAFL